MAVAAFSLVIFYLAVHFAQPQEFVTQAVAASQDEMALDYVGGPQAGAAPA